VSEPLHVDLTDSDIALAVTAMQATFEHASTAKAARGVTARPGTRAR
jgi:hypothetical protein